MDTALRWRVEGQYDGLWDGQVGAMEDDAANIHGDDGVLHSAYPGYRDAFEVTAPRWGMFTHL